MILDSSAIVAIMKGESEAETCMQAIESAPKSENWLSAANFFEAAIVVDGLRNPDASRRFDLFMHATPVQIVPVTEAQVQIARQAYRDFGRGSGHPARLNFGDCFAYALATERDEPLLFVGQGFIHTDLRRVLG